MNMSDYKEGTQFIILCRKMFKDEEDFEAICKFLMFPTDLNKIEIPVDYDRWEKHIILNI